MKVCVLSCALLLSSATALSQHTAGAAKDNPKQSDFYLRDIARQAGNIGGWWGLLNENERAAFLTGFQAAMKLSYMHSMSLCKAVKDRVKPSSEKQAFDDQVSAAIAACITPYELDGFNKITIKDLNNFYSDSLNQAMVIEWSMVYLRDKLRVERLRVSCWTPWKRNRRTCTTAPNIRTSASWVLKTPHHLNENTQPFGKLMTCLADAVMNQC